MPGTVVSTLHNLGHLTYFSEVREDTSGGEGGVMTTYGGGYSFS